MNDETENAPGRPVVNDMALGAVKDCVLWQWDHLGAELDARRKIEGGR